MVTAMQTASTDSTRLLLPLKEASHQLCIAIPTLRRWLREGRITYIRCGRALRIEANEIRRFIDDNRSNSSHGRALLRKS
jgi:excisionase family DNA binding protein